jgi:hypothetical protein
MNATFSREHPPVRTRFGDFPFCFFFILPPFRLRADPNSPRPELSAVTLPSLQFFLSYYFFSAPISTACGLLFHPLWCRFSLAATHSPSSYPLFYVSIFPVSLQPFPRSHILREVAFQPNNRTHLIPDSGFH